MRSTVPTGAVSLHGVIKNTILSLTDGMVFSIY